jgi:glyoxylase-like metal-dependent hydrolase (beta-lactamase superfamily II)
MQRTRLRFSTAIITGLLLAACGDDKDSEPSTSVSPLQPDANAALNKAYSGLGGMEALMELSGFEYETSGDQYVLNEGFVPNSVTYTTSYDTKRTIAVPGDRLRLETERTIDFIGVQGENTYVEIVNGNAGYLQGDEALAPGFAAADTAMSSARVGAVKKQQMLLNPHLLLARVARGEVQATSEGVDLVGGQLQQVVGVGGINLYIDASTGFVTKASTLEDVSPYKDAMVEAVFDGWVPASGSSLMFPMLAAVTVAGERVLAEGRTQTTVLAQLDETRFQLPGQPGAFSQAEADRGMESSASVIQPQALGIPFRDNLQPTVTPVELAPGVWHITGGSHHSMIVEQANGYVLVEAPLDPLRTLAVTNWAATQLAGKPLTHVITTHHHEDHSAGVRQAVGRGARLVAHKAGGEFWQRVLAAEATVVQDSLAGGAPRTAVSFVGDGDSMLLPDATNPVTAYSVGNCHAADMLVIGVGTFMFASDIVGPGNGQPICPFSETMAALATYNFTPVTVVGGHGATAPAADILAQFP